MQKVLTLYTTRGTMRAEVEGWSNEDGDAVIDAWYERLRDVDAKQYAHINDMPVGCIGGTLGRYQVPLYPTVLHAIGDGWKLLAPPVVSSEVRYAMVNDRETPHSVKCYEWWLVKD